MKRFASWLLEHPAWTAVGVIAAIAFGVVGLFQGGSSEFAKINVFKVEADNGAWQGSGTKLGNNDKARVSPVGRWGVVDPTKRGTTGPTGNGVQAGPTYALSTTGSFESCLILKVGNGQATCFSSDSGSEILSGPGEIRFRVNDDLDKREHKNPDFQAFRDNSGYLRVFIEINPVEGN